MLRSFLPRLILPACLILLSLVTFQSLGDFPGLHRDEVWFGFRALEMQTEGLTDTSGMTWYTGSIFPYGISLIFDLFGPEVWTLRLLSVLSFLGLATTLVATIWKHFGLWSASFLAALISQSLLFLWYARVAWEVTAFIWLFFGLSFAAILTVLFRLGASGREKSTTTPLLIFYYAIWLGLLNHLIFGVYVLALSGAVLAHAMWRRSDLSRRLVAAVVPVNSLLVLVALKPMLDGRAQGQPLLIWAFLLIGPPLAFALSPPLVRLGLVLNGRLSVLMPRIRSHRLTWGTAIGLAAPTVIIHGLALYLTLANGSVINRVVSGGVGLPVHIAYRVFAVLLLGLFAYAFTKLLRTRPPGIPESHLAAAFVTGAAALLFMMLLPIATTQASVRYYAIPILLLYTTLAITLPYLFPSRKPIILGTACAVAFLSLGVDQLSKQSLGSRPPITFTLGLFMEETSAHTTPIYPVERAMTAQRICPDRLDGDDFIIAPLRFRFRVSPWGCSPSTRATVNYCTDCSETGYVRLSVAQD